ncbi:Uncharacterized protein APZ42_029632 [Daphnia magna]|uniref:RNA-directed DNA polymerase n=1 Tax=Daphnia magna TaxID=35525 RepID=A0A164PFQ2_9CRUS|nr:Uncharacterized protein APZ42_029632 [Daphnia magna]
MYDVITGGSKTACTPLQPIVPDDLGTADLVDSGHPAVKPLPSKPESSDGVDETNDPAETPDVCTTGATPPTGEEDSDIGPTGIRPDSDLHIVRDTVPGIPAGSDLLHHGPAKHHAEERQDYCGLYSGFWVFDISGGHPESHPVPAGTVPVNPTGAAGPRDELVAEEIRQPSGSEQPEQRTARRRDPTNALQNQDTTETIPTVEYCGRGTTAVRGITAKYRRRRRELVENLDRNAEDIVENLFRLRQYGQLPFPTRVATARDLDGFQNNQYTFSRLQLLPSFTGSPTTRFDSWLESFESIVDDSGWSVEKNIQMLRAKLTDRAFSIIQAVLKDHPHDYDSIKEALLDYFHGDDNVDLYLKKFNKAKRKPSKKVVDYALRLQEIFRCAYPVVHSKKSFTIILMQKFMERLDSKLQAKVKYEDFTNCCINTCSVKKLYLNKKDVSYPSKASYKKQISFPMPTANKDGITSQVPLNFRKTSKGSTVASGQLMKCLILNPDNSQNYQPFRMNQHQGEKVTLGKVTLPIGWDAIQKYAFRLDGETKSIYLARDEKDPSAISRAPEMAEFILKNLSEKIPRNTKLGVIEIIHYVIEKISLNQPEARPNEITEPIVISEVDLEFQVPLSKLLNDFHDLFASKDSELGNTNLIKHTIDTEGRGPIRQCPYRVTNSQRKLLEDKVQEMLNAKVIRNSKSPWASPVVLVAMALGLCNEPTTFQRLMNYVLRNVLGSKALVYLDDDIIFSDAFEDHLRDIREIFKLLKEDNLKLKINKCLFIKRSVDYLCHVISTDGIEPDPGKIDRIVNYKTTSFVDEKPFAWETEEQVTFKKLRNSLVTPPVLVYPNFNENFLLFTDPCEYGIEAGIEYFGITLHRYELPSKDSKREEINHQLVLPLALRHYVLKELHDAPMGGHLAFYQTYLKVKNLYYWPTMREDILEYCQACETCTANSFSTYKAFLNPYELAKAPFQVIGIDFLSPITPVLVIFYFQRVRKESEKARNRQREKDNKRAKEKKYVVGDRVLLNIRVVKNGDSRKFTSTYKRPYRVVKVNNFLLSTLQFLPSSETQFKVPVSSVKLIL